MVGGIEKFNSHFKNFQDCYIVIGGTACDDHFQNQGLSFRSTKDVDIILVIESINIDFIRVFWDFIKDGGYQINQTNQGKPQFYRFINPVSKEYPDQLELFSRKPDVIELDPNVHLTPIPVTEDLSSMSAILLDDDYYELTKSNSNKGTTIHRADDLALICLKIKAYLNNKERKEAGEKIDNKNITKHRNDVFRLAATLRRGDRLTGLTEYVKKDIVTFIEHVSEVKPDVRNLMKAMGISSSLINLDFLIELLTEVFEIES